MHHISFCAFLDHGCPGEADDGPWWDDASIAAAARAYLLSRWIAEDAPRGSAVPGLYAVGRRHDRSSRARGDWVNLATVYETGLFPHIDPPSDSARQALGCQPLDKDALGKTVTEAVLRPWRDHGAEPSLRVTALLDEFLSLLTEYRSEFHAVEAVGFDDGRPVPGDLHVLSAGAYDVIRLSVLPYAPAPVRRGGLLPHPGCSFGGHGCSDGHLLADDDADRVHAALRAMSAGMLLSEGLPVSNNTHISFAVRLASHNLTAVDAQTVTSWIADSGWGDELAAWGSEFNIVFEPKSWRAEVAALAAECRETYLSFAEIADEAVAGELVDELLRDMLDDPVSRVTGGTADGDAGVCVVAALGEDGWFGLDEPVFVVFVGPKEAMMLRIDGVA
ncbi:hypothetical protein GCM10023205_78660 [Yinghuangia aomiensis]|uniref:Uncharacterized protein n=1 Tax=Yinghuangia aomiensis TaxID=676205 RepID=A0ABP9IBV0_9ACTN